MTNNVNYFIGDIITTKNRVVKRCGVVIQVKLEGTVKCKIEDNDGKVHLIIIPNLNYVPEAPICVLSPQQ